MEQGTTEWFAARLGKVTASRLSDVNMKKTTAGYQNYKAQLIAERLTGTPPDSFSSAAMQWGTDQEPNARAAYSFLHSVEVDEIGFVDHPRLEWSGASPDGLVGNDGLVEIKCPNTATHIATLEGGNIQGKYALQMQWQMACTERAWCDFASFDPRLPVEMQLHVVRVERDDELIKELEEKTAAFLAEVAASVDNLTAKYLQKEAA
jgi:putative phage-type endonuclease